MREWFPLNCLQMFTIAPIVRIEVDGIQAIVIVWVVSVMGGRYRQKYKEYKRIRTNRNGIIIICNTVYIIWKDVVKIQIDNTSLVEWNSQTTNCLVSFAAVFWAVTWERCVTAQKTASKETTNGLDSLESVQSPLLNWFNEHTSGQFLT